MTIAGEFVIADAGSLPGQRPASRSPADIVRSVAGDQNIAIGFQRQELFVILDQNPRLAHGLASKRPMVRAAEQFETAGIRSVGWAAGFKQSGANFDAKDIGYRILEPVHRYNAAFRLFQQAVVERFPCIRRHIHVEPCIDRLRTAGIGATQYLAMGIPVTDDETAKAHPLFQDVGQQSFVSGYFLAIPAGKTGHDGLDTSIDRRDIGAAVNIAQFRFADFGIALIATLIGAAVGQKMFGAGQYMGAR